MRLTAVCPIVLVPTVLAFMLLSALQHEKFTGSATGTGYRLSAGGDTLQITVFGEIGPDQLSIPSLPAGTVDMPLIGSVPAVGLTLAAAATATRTAPGRESRELPNVTLSITTYRPFFILGEVKILAPTRTYPT